mgnify:CR=1 FL=1
MKKLSMEALGRKTVEEYKKIDKLPIVVLLDNRDAGCKHFLLTIIEPVATVSMEGCEICD